MANQMEAWKINEKDFPHEGSDAEKLAFAVRYAILAPSPYNSQPWYFRISGNMVSLYADRRYGLAIIDPDDREMTICCAAALYNLRLALRYFGYNETTELLPDPEDRDLLARVKLGSKSDKALVESRRALFKAITKRHMNRGVFSDKEVPEELVSALKSAATKEGAWLHVCSEVERHTIAHMIAEADHVQAANKNFRRELASWVDRRREISGDGMAAYGVKYEDIIKSLAPTVIRRFENADGTAASDMDLLENTPLLVVLGSNSGGTVEHLNAGQALERVLLTAEANGLSVTPLNQPCQVPELRLRLHDELEHHGRAHMILRIGYGKKSYCLPRRPLASFVEFEGRTAQKAEKLITKKPANTQSGGIFKKLFKGFGR